MKNGWLFSLGLGLVAGFLLGLSTAQIAQTAKRQAVPAMSASDLPGGVRGVYATCEIRSSSLDNGRFYIIARGEKDPRTGYVNQFADALSLLSRQGYQGFISLPQDNLPPNMMAVWATKERSERKE